MRRVKYVVALLENAKKVITLHSTWWILRKPLIERSIGIDTEGQKISTVAKLYTKQKSVIRIDGKCLEPGIIWKIG